ncbi:helix-turn-helix domain-containing protein [Euzebya tangerina]|uniref:helix-turn-helix domain-containing protein n=1 Tax=Euzebya tangerina TaxID=591198 RepID=UPI000E30CB07|nr:helix-turn-helix domain-containing protein [Euzebya tangerina]
MAGIGETLSSERRRQGRTLADAAAETRVRESYLAALETEDFDVLGGDVYARGFIRLYGKYLGLDAEALVQEFRDNHEKPAEVTAIPGATIDEVLPARPPGIAQLLNQPAVAGVAIVLVMAVLFLLFRGGGDDAAELDEDAPGPVPAATQEVAETEDAAAGDAATVPSEPSAAPAPAPDAVVFETLAVQIDATTPVRVNVLQGQPVVDRELAAAESVELAPSGDRVSFVVGDYGSVEVLVNGLMLPAPAQFLGAPVQITCVIGATECSAEAVSS